MTDRMGGAAPSAGMAQLDSRGWWLDNRRIMTVRHSCPSSHSRLTDWSVEGPPVIALPLVLILTSAGTGATT
jgi:hypothetical protein